MGKRGGLAFSDTVISEQVNKSENSKPHGKKFPKVGNLEISDLFPSQKSIVIGV